MKNLNPMNLVETERVPTMDGMPAKNGSGSQLPWTIFQTPNPGGRETPESNG
jgi:hypothetical protein